MHQYKPGNAITLLAEFRVRSGVLTDPGTVTLTVREPDATLRTFVYGTNVELMKDEAGKYHCDVDCDKVGIYFYRYAGTSPCKAAAEDAFEVEPSTVA